MTTCDAHSKGTWAFPLKTACKINDFVLIFPGFLEGCPLSFFHRLDKLESYVLSVKHIPILLTRRPRSLCIRISTWNVSRGWPLEWWRALKDLRASSVFSVRPLPQVESLQADLLAAVNISPGKLDPTANLFLRQPSRPRLRGQIFKIGPLPSDWRTNDVSTATLFGWSVFGRTASLPISLRWNPWKRWPLNHLQLPSFSPPHLAKQASWLIIYVLNSLLLAFIKVQLIISFY